jgi:4-hydroxy-tetrahydrodipicolinate synthase
MQAGDPCPIGMRGIVPSLNTPFDRAGDVDEAAVARLVEASIGAGVVGLLTLAVAGEQGSLGRDEKERIARATVDTAGRRVPIIVSVTAPEPAESVALAKLARASGADGICCQAPAGVAAGALRDALARIADAGPDLLMVQDLDWSGPGLAIETIVDLFAAVPQFKCLKVETVPAGPKYSRVLAATGGRLHVSGGWAVTQMPEALARGVHAFMPTALDPIYVAIHAAHRAGRAAAARALFELLLPVLAFTNQHIHVSIRFLKRLRLAQGVFASDHCRPPVPPFDDVQAAEMERLIARALELQGRVTTGAVWREIDEA